MIRKTQKYSIKTTNEAVFFHVQGFVLKITHGIEKITHPSDI